MYPFNDRVATTKKSKWVNTCEYIIIHHTGGGSYADNLAYLSTNPAQVSCHFIIWPSEERAKIWDPKDVLRHAGESKWGNLSDMNNYSLGIEVVGYWEFNQYQFIALIDLVQYLMWTFWIRKENVIRHADITQEDMYTKEKILRDGRRKARKVDISSDFFPKWFERRREGLYPRMESRYGLYN